MLGRALSLATVVLLIGCFAAAPMRAQGQNLEAGKSPSQIFAGTCTACHKSPRGLLRTVPAGSLPGFLREHYTTSSGMASLLSTYLISNGAADTRYGGGQPRPDKGAKSEARSGEPELADRYGRRIKPPREAAEPPPSGKPDADRLSSQAEPRHRGRNARRLERAGEGPDAAKPAEALAPAQQADQHGRDGRRLRPGKRGRPGRPVIDAEPGMGAATPEAGKSEAAKSDDAKSDDAKSQAGKTDAAKTDAAKDQSAKTEPAKEEKPVAGSASDAGSKPVAAKPPGEGSSEAAKVEPPEETGSSAAPVQRADPVPPVAPAPAAASPAASTAAPGGTSPAASSAPTAPPAPSAPAPPPAAPAAAVATSAAPAAPAAPDGSPTPPISK
jgi:hypothetical protein